jgi:hypothetical protein
LDDAATKLSAKEKTQPATIASPATTAAGEGQQVASVAGLLDYSADKSLAKVEVRPATVSSPATAAAEDGHTTAILLSYVVDPTIDASRFESDDAATIVTEAAADPAANFLAEAAGKAGDKNVTLDGADTSDEAAAIPGHKNVTPDWHSGRNGSRSW